MFNLPKLPYKYDALTPFIDEKTMRIHHTKHHQGYINNLNDTLADLPEWKNKDIDEILINIDEIPQDIRQLVINNGGGHANHSFFWQILTPNDQKQASMSELKIIQAIEAKWGLKDFKEQFSQTAVSQFGSGWGWLVVNEQKELEIISTANQDSPLMISKIPILGIDVWEHAYYLQYQNKRADYIENFWQIVNWSRVNELFVACQV